MENTQIAARLEAMAKMLELTGESPFRVRAYRRAAQLIELLPTPLAQLASEGKLHELPGIGEGIERHVTELLQRGSFAEYEALARKVPEGVRTLLTVEGVGPKTAQAAWKKLHITTLDELEAACRDGRLASLPRVGERRVVAIAEALARLRARGGRTPLHRALGVAEALLARIRKAPGVVRADAAGSLRRRKETVGDLDLLAAARDATGATRALTTAPEVARVLATGPTRSTVLLEDGLQVDLRVVEPRAWGAALHYFTGSKSHNIAIRTRALKRHLKLSEYGLFDAHDKRVGGATEEEIFAAVGLPFIPPELREDSGEVEAAEKGELPHLVEEADLLGDLHVHSDASSDATSSLEELAAAAHALGREYLVISEHSRSRPLGLDAARLAAHAEKIRALDRKLAGKPHLLAGVEVDILKDGALDLPLPALRNLDFVVASIHAGFSDPAAKNTARLIKAIQSGVVDVLGHPSGRLLGVRDAYPFDLEKVLAAARRAGVALEVNATPERLDLDGLGCRAAKKAGVRVAISSDAHHASQLQNLRYGVWMARRGWLEKGDVLNALPWRELLRHAHHAHVA